MIVKFYDTFRNELKIDSEAATYLYTGMVTDSGRFKYSGVTGDTLRCAAVLLDVGVDTDTLFARLYLEAYEYLKFKAHIYNKMEITPNGVAYIFVDKDMQKQFGLSLEQASAVIGNLDASVGLLSLRQKIPSGSVSVPVLSRLTALLRNTTAAAMHAPAVPPSTPRKKWRIFSGTPTHLSKNTKIHMRVGYENTDYKRRRTGSCPADASDQLVP